MWLAGPLEHVMYMDPDPTTRSMTLIPPSPDIPSLAPNPRHEGYESYTGGGGWSLDGRRRQATQLKCRPDAESMQDYCEWHRKVWPELQVRFFFLHCSNPSPKPACGTPPYFRRSV